MNYVDDNYHLHIFKLTYDLLQIRDPGWVWGGGFGGLKPLDPALLDGCGPDSCLFKYTLPLNECECSPSESNLPEKFVPRFCIRA